jgi:hypothetical protein
MIIYDFNNCMKKPDNLKNNNYAKHYVKLKKFNSLFSFYRKFLSPEIKIN